MLRIQHGRATPAPLQPLHSGPRCIREGPRVPPDSHPCIRGLGRNGGGCSTAALRGNGPRKASGRQTAAGARLASPQAVRGPCFPCTRCPVEISSRLAGLDRQPEEAAQRAPWGPPGNLGKTGTAAAPSLPAAARSPLNPPHGCARRLPSPRAGVRAFAVIRAGGNVAKPGPCCTGKARLSRCASQRRACPWSAQSGRQPGSPTAGVAPCWCCQSRLPPRASSLPGLPARLMLSQVRRMKGCSRGTGERWWRHEGHAASQRRGGSAL